MASSLILRVDETPHVGLSGEYDDKEKGAVALTDEERIKKAGGLPEIDLIRLLEGTSKEPRWRKEADKCADYYDGNQLDAETLEMMQKRGVPPLIINLIQPTVNTVLGMEARQRTDWQVTFDEPEYEMVAQAINKKLNEFERTTFADRACSNAYAGQVKAGLHWVEVARNPNPLAVSPYRCKDVHRREIWWDWAEDSPDDWRYLVRKRWIDADRLTKFFPQHESLIRYCSSRWTGWGRFTEDLYEQTGLSRSYDIERAFTVTENEWRDTERHRLVTYEIWYRVWVRGYIAMLNDGRRIPLDPENPRHNALIAAGVLQPMASAYPVMRQAFFIGPHRVLDRPSPLPHRGFPYTPFFGFREDLTRAPYGLIRSMLSPQDEINARRSRLMALLGSRRAQMDSDALDTVTNDLSDVASEISRADSFIVTNPKRKNIQHGIRIDDNNDLSNGQAQILADSKSEIHQASGVFQEVAGQTKSTLSGIALDGLVQQGTTTLAEINDNFLMARREVGEQAVAFIKADSRHPHHVGIGEGKSRKKIFLNGRVPDPVTGEEKTINPVEESDVRVILEDVPSSPTYRQQQFEHLARLTAQLPPQLQAFVTDFVIESSDLKERKQMAKRIRRMMNIPEPGMEDDPNGGMSPEMTALMQQHEEQIKLITEQAQLAMSEAEKFKAAAADKDDANAVKKYEVDRKTEAENADRELKKRELDIKERELAAKGDEQFFAQLNADATPAEPAMDVKALLNDIMANITPKLEKVTIDVAKSIDKARTETDKKVSDVTKLVVDQATREKAEPKQANPPVVIEAGAISVTVVNEPGKPVKKTVTMPDGRKATIEPEQ